MTKLLTLDEMLDVLEIIQHPAAPNIARQLEAVGDLMAQAIAEKLGVECGDTHREESAFAGTCAGFFPATPGQPCPEPLAGSCSTRRKGPRATHGAGTLSRTPRS